MLSYYRVRTFARWIAEMLDKGEDPEKIRLICLEFEYRLAFEAEQERAERNGAVSREWSAPRR